MFYGNILNEKVKSESKDITFEVNGKKYSIYLNDNNITDNISKWKTKIIARTKAILSHEESIKKQVYFLYNSTDKEKMNKDKIENFDVVAPTHEEFKKDGFEVGIFFSNVNQFYVRVDKAFKVYDDDTTYIY